MTICRGMPLDFLPACERKQLNGYYATKARLTCHGNGFFTASIWCNENYYYQMDADFGNMLRKAIWMAQAVPKGFLS